MNKVNVFLGVLFFGLLVLVFPVIAGPPPLIIFPSFPPDTINISGVLVDSNSKPYTGNIDLDFLVYKGGDLGSGGVQIWEKTYWNSTLDNKGYFSIPIGGKETVGLLRAFPKFENTDIATGTPYYLRIAVRQGQGSWTMLNPGQRLTTVPYALQARKATYASALSSESGSILSPDDFVKKSGDSMTGQLGVGRSSSLFFDVQFKALGNNNGGDNCNMVLEPKSGKGWYLSAGNDGKLKIDTMTYVNDTTAQWGAGKLIIDTAGNVGLGGASSPLGRLHVNGAGSAVDLVLTDAASTKGWSIRESNGDLQYLVKLANSNVLYSGGPVFKPDGSVTISGNVGLGGVSSPLGRLHLDGGGSAVDLVLTDAASTKGWSIRESNGDLQYLVKLANSNVLYSGGPVFKPDGSVTVSGDLTVNGAIKGNMNFKNLGVYADSGVAIHATSPNDTAVWAETSNADGTAIDARNNAAGTAISIAGGIHIDRETQTQTWTWQAGWQFAIPFSGQTYTFTTNAPLITINVNYSGGGQTATVWYDHIICPVVRPGAIFLPVSVNDNAYKIINVQNGSFDFKPGYLGASYTFLIIN